MTDKEIKFHPLWPDGPLFAQAEHFRLSTDCVLLADFVNGDRAARGIDLGCASGAIALLLLARLPRLHMTGLEIQPAAARLAEENMAKNGFQERSRIVAGDIRRHRELFKTGSFDLVVSNPPYFPVGGGKSGGPTRSEIACSLEDLCTAAGRLAKNGGRFALCHRPERLADVICALRAHGLEPKRLKLVSHAPGYQPSLLLVEAVRQGRPGLKIEMAPSPGRHSFS